MVDEIKQKILKDIEEWKSKCYPNPPDKNFNLIVWKELQGRLNQHKETKEYFLELINKLLPKYYEDGADEFARQLEFALGVKNE